MYNHVMGEDAERQKYESVEAHTGKKLQTI